jgi:hypothetical protein
MSYPINYPTPQQANVQIFNAGSSTTSWVKPQGASFVWFTLIGAGGTGSGGAGGTGAVTNCLVPAFLIPDELQISVGTPSVDTSVNYVSKATYNLLTARSGNIGSGGTATNSNFFSAAGLFQSIGGQAGNVGTPSTTTFLSGGIMSGNNTANYGYSTATIGFFQTQPIMVGVGGSNTGKGGIGCGGGSSGSGGNGLVVIISW